MPSHWPQIAPPASGDYRDFAFAYTYPYVEPCLAAAEYRPLVDEAYRRFADPPLLKLREGLWLLDLSGGPSLAFKDFAMQLLAGLFAKLGKNGLNVLVATSGDTGSAAAAALGGVEGNNLFILHPRGRIAELQRRQMTTCEADNVHNLAICGDFDSCQAIVKTLLAENDDFTGVNSVNWARIAAQTAYYGWATAELAKSGVRRPNFVVPTGNFGNIFAAFAAERTGLAIGKLIMAVNANDALVRLLSDGRLEKKTAIATLSPSMDIQVPSNLERILYELAGREQTTELMAGFEATGTLQLSPQLLKRLHGKFAAIAVNDDATLAAMGEVYGENGLIIDPHTAVGIAAAQRAGLGTKPDTSGTFCCLATAAAAKFPQAVERAIGKKPPIPPQLTKAAAAQESFTTLPADIVKVGDYIRNALKKHV